MKTQRLRKLYHFWAKIYDAFLEPIFRFDRKHVISQLEIKKKQKILEVGVGTGLNLPYYPVYCKVEGIDLSKEMLQHAKRKAKKNITLKVMDATRISFRKNTFDGALLTFAIRAIPEPRKALKELERVTKPKARIVIYDSFGKKSFWDIFEKIGWGKNYVLEELLKETRLKVVKKERNSLYVLENRKKI